MVGVSALCHALEGHLILAGGETTGFGCEKHQRPGGPPETVSGLTAFRPPLQGSIVWGDLVPVVSPPAKFGHPFGVWISTDCRHPPATDLGS